MKVSRWDHQYRRVSAFLARCSISWALGSSDLGIDAWANMLHVALVALIEAALMTEEVLDLLPPHLFLAVGQQGHFIRETLLLAEDDVPLLVHLSVLHFAG